MKFDFKVKVGKYAVSVVGADRPTLVRFRNAAKGKNGVFSFWTAVLKKGATRKIWGRSQVGMSAGDRFDRMERQSRGEVPKEDQVIYGRMWAMMNKGANISHIRPTTHSELFRWLNSHSGTRFGKWTLL